jgi:hypothetical protein
VSGGLPPDVALALSEPVAALHRVGTALVATLELLGDPGLGELARAEATARLCLDLDATRAGLDVVGSVMRAYGLAAPDRPMVGLGQLVVLPPRLRRRFGCARTPWPGEG